MRKVIFNSRINSSLILVLCWFVTFPTQGVFYQASIYLLPILCFFQRGKRRDLLSLLKREKELIFLIVVPIILAFLGFALSNIGEQPFGLIVKEFDILFEYAWRLVLLSLVMAVALMRLKLSQREVILLLYAASLVHAVMAVFVHKAMLGNPLEYLERHRLVGVIDSPNEFGILMAVGVVTSVVVSQWQHKRSHLVMFLLPLLMFFPLLLGSQSRTAWIAVLTGLVTLLFFKIRLHGWKNLKYPIIVLAAVLVVAAFVFVFFEPLYRRISGLFSDPVRVSIWVHFLDVWKENAVIGTFSLRDLYHVYPVDQRIIFNPHSVPLDIAVRTGVVGLVAFGLFLVVVANRALKAAYRAEVISLLFVVFVSGLFGFSIYEKTFIQSLYMILLLLYFLSEKKKNQRFERENGVRIRS